MISESDVVKYMKSIVYEDEREDEKQPQIVLTNEDSQHIANIIFTFMNDDAPQGVKDIDTVIKAVYVNYISEIEDRLQPLLIASASGQYNN